MSLRIRPAICIILFAPVYLLLYTILHEAGHAIVIISCGGTINTFHILGLDAHVASHGESFSVFCAALNNAAGMLLPIIIGAAALGFYRPNTRFHGYHLCYFLGSVSLLFSALVWVAFPVVSLFTALPQSEDVTKFLNITDFHPLLVSLGR